MLGSDDIPSPVPWDVMIFLGETLPMGPGFVDYREGEVNLARSFSEKKCELIILGNGNLGKIIYIVPHTSRAELDGV